MGVGGSLSSYILGQKRPLPNSYRARNLLRMKQNEDRPFDVASEKNVDFFLNFFGPLFPGKITSFDLLAYGVVNIFPCKIEFKGYSNS